MSIVFCNDGRRGVLGALLPFFSTLTCRLFVNDFTPTRMSVIGDFLEATFNSYSGLVLSSWAGVVLDASGNATAIHDVHTWFVSEPGSAQSVYGYYVTDSHNFVLWCERNPAGAVRMTQAGDSFPLAPRVSAGALC